MIDFSLLQQLIADGQVFRLSWCLWAVFKCRSGVSVHHLVKC